METSNLHHQMMASNPLEEVLSCPNLPLPAADRKPRPQPDQALRCPRCDSTNTKFCYYNNYSLTQPRYFCKGCRRYWTKGGTLRNVPVGGGCRKNKRSSSSSSKKAQQENQALAAVPGGALLTSLPPPPPPALVFDSNDFMLGNPNTNPVPLTPQVPSFLDILRSGFPDGSASPFDNLYYGFGGHGTVEEVEGGELDATISIKQESSCKSADGDNRLFMGLQWQTGADGNMLVDPGRDYWNGSVGCSSWHALVNSYTI